MVGAGEADPVGVDARQPFLGRHGAGVVERVLVLHPVDHRRRVDVVLAARVLSDQGQEVAGLGVEALQAGQVVGDQHLLLGTGAPGEVPRRPGVPRARQHRGVGVQERGVRRVGHRAEHVSLRGGRLGEHRDRLARVGRDHDGVEELHRAVAVGDLDAVGGLEDRRDLDAGADLLEPRGHRGDVPLRATGHRPPLGAAEDAEHPVVLEEGEQVARRVVERHLRVARPHGGDERLHEVAVEVRREPPVLEEVAQGEVRPVGGQQPARSPVELRDLGEQPQVARVAQVRGRGEEAPGAQRARPLEPGVVVADGHRHLGGLGDHAQLGEEPEQHRVGAWVVHDEAGVDRQLTVSLAYDVGVGVAAQPLVGLEERHVRRARGDVRRRQPGHSRADDRDALRCRSH